jgi:hypothetical protein
MSIDKNVDCQIALALLFREASAVPIDLVVEDSDRTWHRLASRPLNWANRRPHARPILCEPYACGSAMSQCRDF